jgi:signal transduction histidine kinase
MTDEGQRPPWRHRLSLRLRITLVTAVVVAVVVALGGILILVALRAELVAAADEAVEARADEIARLAADDALPRPLPPMHDPVTFSEVVSGGRTVTATDSLLGGTGFDLPAQEAGQVDVSGVPRLPLAGTGPYRVAAQGVDTPSGPMTVFVAVSIAHLDHTMAVAARIGAIGVVLLVVVLATVTWLAIGRSLAPVEGIRARAEAITGQNLDRRVPVPDQLDEIGRLARTVNQMLGRLERSAARQRRFVADAAHELRSPIASLRVQLETARDTEETAGREGDMLYETTRMEGLVDQLVVLARADADTSWLRLETVDLDDLIDSAVTSLAPRDGLVIDTNAVEPVQLCGDARMLEQVVRNLVHNALGHARGTVRVSTSAAGDDLAVLIVDDDGPGVPEDRRDDIFERFVRLDASRDRDHGGVGLGLAIVAEIVRAHGGRVHVSDSPSGGARFVVELPITAVDTHTSQSTPGIR